MHNLPSHIHHIAMHEARRAQLVRQVETELVLGRIRSLLHRAKVAITRVEEVSLALDVAMQPEQPTMRRDGRIRSQPRDGRGRLLGKRWLDCAERYSADDVAWFRSPITEGR